MLTQVLVAHRRPDSPPLRAMPEFLTNFSFVLFLHFSLFLLRGFSVSVWLPCVDAYTGPGLCSRFLIEQRFLKQQSVAGAGAELSSAALRSPASPALRLQPAAQIGELCNMRCSVSWPSGSMELCKAVCLLFCLGFSGSREWGPEMFFFCLMGSIRGGVQGCMLF